MKKEITFAQLKRFIRESKWDTPAYLAAIERNEEIRRRERLERERRKPQAQKELEFKKYLINNAIINLGNTGPAGRDEQIPYIKANIEKAIRDYAQWHKRFYGGDDRVTPEIVDDAVTNWKTYLGSNTDWQIDHLLTIMDL